MYMDKQNVSREEVEDFFGPSNFASESEEILEDATPVEIKSWSIEDFIVEAVHKNADKAIERARELASKPAVDIFNAEEREQFVESVEATRKTLSQPEVIAETMAAFEQVNEDIKFDPVAGDRNFQRSLKVMKRELQKHIADIYKKESVQMLKKIESMGGGGGGGGGDSEQVQANTDNIAILSASSSFSPQISANQKKIEGIALSGTSGFDVTGAFAGKDASAGAVWTETGGILYGPDDVNTVMTFSLDPAIQGRTDGTYWSVPEPADPVGTGLFGGAYLPNEPENKTPIFAFSAVNTDTFNDGSNVETVGRISLSGCSYGDQLRLRFDLNVIPQVTNTTVTPMLWYNNATPAGVVTYSFELPTQPVFYGQGTTGKQHLMRVEISAWIGNEEDVHALVYPAVKADNPCIFKPSSMMATILR